MRFTIDKEQFSKALNAASKAVPTKSANPILPNFCLTLNEKGLEVLGFNGDFAVKSTVPYMINDREIIRNAGVGSTLVNAKTLAEILRSIEGNEVSVEVIDEAIMKIDDGKFSSAYEFSSLIEQSAFAASQRDQRGILNALHLEAENDKLIATATDSARLARKECPIDSDVRFAVNVPAKAALDIIHMFDGAKNVTVSIATRKILVFFDNTVVSSSLIPGDYPVTRSIIPTMFNYTLEANSSELLGAMNRVRILSMDSEPVVTIVMDEEEVEVSARNDASGSATERISTFQYSGERLQVSFNSQFVIDAIKAVKSEDVVICFLGEMKPFVVKNPKDESVVELITPMRTF